MLEGSRQISTEGKNLEATTAEIAHGMNEMGVGAGEVNSLSGRNRDTITGKRSFSV
ncbi:hypothetical protein FACS1894200_08880 [Spirochaetia bacterium]|nr:hypothetical protein FACS1894200_08880 [Spirochaetia bacterium]